MCVCAFICHVCFAVCCCDVCLHYVAVLCLLLCCFALFGLMCYLLAGCELFGSVWLLLVVCVRACVCGCHDVMWLCSCVFMCWIGVDMFRYACVVYWCCVDMWL